MRPTLFALLATATLTVGPALAQPAAQPADRVIWGGPVYTAETAQPTAEAVAVRAGRIAYVGTRAGAQALVGPQTEIIDLKGGALFPGFTDGHVHLRGIGEREQTLNLEGSKSAAEVVERLRARIATAKPGEVIVGRGWIETGWPEGRFLEARDLDPVSPNNPVLLERADGHATTVNTAALKAAGITGKTEAPFGGEILKDAQGNPTGMLVDNAANLVAGLIPAVDEAYRVKALKTGMDVEVRYGWTGVHTVSTPWGDVLALEALAAKGEVPLRIYAAVDRADADQLFASGPRATPDARVVTRAIKLYADGALGSRGAALLAPYADKPDTSGLMLLTEDTTRPLLQRAAKSGIQIAAHGIGDRANQIVLDLFAETLPAAGPDPRWRVEHAQHLQPSDITRFGQLKVIASMQPSHAIGDLFFAPARLGSERLGGAYAWQAILKSGGRLVGGSDAPVERGDPLIEFYASVARKSLDGFANADWHPEQALTRDQALRLFTLDAAYARFAEDELGSIKVGKRADLTAFSVDLMKAPEADILKGRAILTMVDGMVVYRAN